VRASTARKNSTGSTTSVAFDTSVKTPTEVPGPNIVPYLPYADLREWLEQALKLARSRK